MPLSRMASFIHGDAGAAASANDATGSDAKKSMPVHRHLIAAVQPFSAAEKALIRKVHGFMPAAQLLALVNERLACDMGPDADPYTMEQLHQEIGDVPSAPVQGSAGGPRDWSGLRKLLAQARRNGTLKSIDERVIDDFAVVYSLNPKQVLGLKDVVLKAAEED